MAIGANSYGSVDEVEALTARYTDGGDYKTTTQPTLAQVENFLDQVSGVLNMLLAEAGFEIPASQADAKLVLDNFAVDMAAALCNAVHGAGPLSPGSKEMRGRLPREAILEAAASFISDHADGLEKLGATRTYSMTDGLECRTKDEAGDDLAPMFDRHQMGNEVIEWDVD